MRLTATFLLAIAALALASQASLRLGPVPLTLQSLAVLLTGAALGPGRGALAVLAWLGLAALGLPVLSPGGRITGPTFGYLAAMPAAAALAGWRPGIRGFLAAHTLLLAAGTAWLATRIGPAAALATLPPLLPGALAKSLLAALIAPHLRATPLSASNAR